ncbi:MAG TPA: bacterial transcriptional activator domain-containing protein, partial [Conexibacter sp.]|nr:bacterial transcriptional activator domain-containing protein [Conexibacter sp.]
MSRELTVCGDVCVDQVPVTVGGLLLVLLTVLAVRGARGAQRGELVELLWPEAAPAAGAAALDPLLSRLRRIAGPISGRGAVRLDPSTRVDLTRALTALDGAAGAAEPARALALALAGARTLAAPLAPGCDHPWVEAQRIALAQRHADALALAAQAGARIQPPPAAALDAARELTALRPLDERPTALLMDLLERAGDRAAAIGAYETARERLRERLAIVPGPELRERHRRLVAEQPPRAQPPL